MTPRSTRTSEDSHILVVEDLEAFRDLVVRVLSSKGFHVVGVGDVLGALALCSNEQFDLLVTDHQLPGGNGTEIARRAFAANPGIKIVFMSGSPASSLDLEVPGATPEFLQKPFEIDLLVSRVLQLLGTPSD